MYNLCCCLMCLTLLGGTARADDGKKDERRPDRQDRRFQFQLGRLGGPLLTEREMEELKLTKEQKEKVEKISKDLGDRQKEALESARKMFEDLGGGGAPDVNKIREAAQKMREAMTGRGKAREEAEDKIKAVLNDEQKKKFDEIQKNRSARGIPGLPEIPRIPGLGGPRTGAFKPGEVLPEALKQRLDLNEEQKKKLEELEKKVKEELNRILTEEQRKKLEQGGRPGIRPRRNDL